jgi:hypothetical protein
MSIFSYFRAPFPSAEGFSPYRMPGMTVHLPLLAASVFVGFLLCWPHPILRPLLIIWVLAGLYLGRDFAIFCHYAMPLALVALVAVMTVLIKAPSISKFGASHVVIPAVVSLVIAGVLIAQIYRSSRP